MCIHDLLRQVVQTLEIAIMEQYPLTWIEPGENGALIFHLPENGAVVIPDFGCCQGNCPDVGITPEMQFNLDEVWYRRPVALVESAPMQ